MHENTFKDICIFILMTENNSLRKCSRCKSTILHKYFSKNRKGEYFKCCDNCKRKKKDKQITSTYEVDEEGISMARADWILTTISGSRDTLIYLGQMDANNVNFPESKFPKVRGDETRIEYHAFENVDMKQKLIFRWRLKHVPNLLEPTHIRTHVA